VSVYCAAVQDWISANSINRDHGLPLAPFVRPIPQRVVLYAEGFEIKQRLEDPDQTLPKPVLPPPANVPPSSPFTTGAASYDSTVLQMLSLILTKLSKAGY
jgi:hypothetical protein